MSALDRHDLRRLCENYLSVQTQCHELEAYCRELVTPSDGTIREVIELLTNQSSTDVKTLYRAITAFCDCVKSLKDYVQLYGDATVRQKEHMQIITLACKARVFIERMVVNVRAKQYDEAVVLANTQASCIGTSLRELDELARCIAVHFGYVDGRTLADDDAQSSVDSDYDPDHDDDSENNLIVGDDDSQNGAEASRAKHARTN